MEIPLQVLPQEQEVLEAVADGIRLVPQEIHPQQLPLKEIQVDYRCHIQVTHHQEIVIQVLAAVEE